MPGRLTSRNFLVLAFAALAVAPMVFGDYGLFIANLALIYIILTVGLNLLVGYSGHIAFANAAMFGIGAYTAGLLQVRLGVPYVIALPLSGLASTLLGTLIAWPALRLSGIYLALATLAFAQATQWVFLNVEWLTFGASGFAVPRLDFAPLPLAATTALYLVSWAIAAALTVAASNIVHSRIGRALVAMRDNDISAKSLGIDLLRYKIIAFALSGFYAGIAGGLYCGVLNYVAPESFDLFQMVMHKAMVVVGGSGSIVGSVIGAVLLVGLQESLREFKSLQEIAFGALLIVFVLFLPGGVVSLLKNVLPGFREDVHRHEPAPTPRAAEALTPRTDRPS
jgi:branched-chain amino acid transport system permease protein